MKLNENELTAEHQIYFKPQAYVQKRVIPQQTRCPNCHITLTIDSENDLYAYWEKGDYTYTNGEWRLCADCMLCGESFSLPARPASGFSMVLDYYKSKLSPYYVWSRTHWELHNIFLGCSLVAWVFFLIPLFVAPALWIVLTNVVLFGTTFKLVQHSFAPKTKERALKPVKEFASRRLHAGDKLKELSG